MMGVVLIICFIPIIVIGGIIMAILRLSEDI
jgi:hypothetical protein